MDRIIVIQEFCHDDGIYRVRYMSAPDGASRLPVIVGDLLLRRPGERLPTLLQSWLLKPVGDAHYGQPELVWCKDADLPLSVTDQEMQLFYDVTLKAFAERLAGMLRPEDAPETPDEVTVLLIVIFVVGLGMLL